jgi:hypothetical protein
MTRDEIEALAAYAQCAQFGTVSVYPWTMRELCRLALIGHAIDKREREVAVMLDEMAAEGQACDALLYAAAHKAALYAITHKEPGGVSADEAPVPASPASPSTAE